MGGTFGAPWAPRVGLKRQKVYVESTVHSTCTMLIVGVATLSAAGALGNDSVALMWSGDHGGVVP
jgi:hypothetical protein